MALLQCCSGAGSLPERRSGAASVIYKNSLYIFGGYGGQGRLEDFYRFDFGGWLLRLVAVVAVAVILVVVVVVVTKSMLWRRVRWGWKSGAAIGEHYAYGFERKATDRSTSRHQRQMLSMFG